ncbi:MAG: type 1 glutamine amidotransferase [Propionibacteriaceae bacterium]|jgi:GMP synthase (glutamine-hydrolysing)|nr:type 1 glutamine amidotransferase [Propionibacteriaceae bacterium]
MSAVNARVAVIANDPAVPLGRLEPWLGQAAWHSVGSGLPGWDDFDGLVVLGGPHSVEDVAQADWLARQGQLMLRCAEAGRPVLAICLGAQLLAKVSGGTVAVPAAAGPERGLIELSLRPAARLDPVLGLVWRRLGSTLWAPSFHSDAITRLPAGASWLAASAHCPYHAFRLGSALGLQFHPEAGLELMASWAEANSATVDLTGFERWADALTSLVEAVAEGFLDQVARFSQG